MSLDTKSRSTKFDVNTCVLLTGYCGNCMVSDSPVVDTEILTYNCVCVSPEVEQIRTYFDMISHMHGQSDT